MKTIFVHEDGDSAKIFNEGDDIAKAFMYESGDTAKKTFVCGTAVVTKFYVKPSTILTHYDAKIMVSHVATDQL